MNLRSFLEELQQNGRSGGLFVLVFIVFLIAAMLWRIILPLAAVGSALYFFPWFVRQSRAPRHWLSTSLLFGLSLIAIFGSLSAAWGDMVPWETPEAVAVCVLGAALYGLLSAFAQGPLRQRLWRVLLPLGVLFIIGLRLIKS